MGSRAVVALCRGNDVARARFGIGGDEPGAIWTRTGRPFFGDAASGGAVLARLRTRVDALDLWTELGSDWLLLNAEIMPWSAEAEAPNESQYAPVASSSRAALEAAVLDLAAAAARGVPTGDVLKRFEASRECTGGYARAWAPYVWSVSSVDDLKIAPFHLLASEGRVWFD